MDRDEDEVTCECGHSEDEHGQYGSRECQDDYCQCYGYEAGGPR